MKIAITGAFGFIGQHLIKHLLDHTDHEIVAISRYPRHADHPRLECVTADLFSLKQTTEALKGCDHAIYLVHSMAPSSRLVQGNFRDLDFILADNFGRAAVRTNVKHVVYVGGMIPPRERLSRHLASRLEVEEVLRSHQIPVTAFRCGLVIGHRASSFSIIVRLTERLPAMILPQWMRTRSNPIFVGDLARLIGESIADPGDTHRIIDAGMSECVSYQDIVVETARVLNKRVKIVEFPYISPHLSKLWVRAVSGAPKSLVYPLIESVRHAMLKSEEHPIPSRWGIIPCGLREAVRRTLKDPFVFEMPRLLSSVRYLNEVRSVQRMALPKGKNAAWMADHYVRWLPWYLKPFIAVIPTSHGCQYRTRIGRVTLLVLEKDAKISSDDRQLFRVTGGALVDPAGAARFEFRESHSRTFLIVALHNFRPALPWIIYRYTQAVLHRLVMAQFSSEAAHL